MTNVIPFPCMEIIRDINEVKLSDVDHCMGYPIKFERHANGFISVTIHLQICGETARGVFIDCCDVIEVRNVKTLVRDYGRYEYCFTVRQEIDACVNDVYQMSNFDEERGNAY